MFASVVARRADDRGAAAVEFALIVPFLATLVFGIISYGVMLSLRQNMSQAASEGARAGAVSAYPDPATQARAGLEAMNDALGSHDLTCAGSAAGSSLTRGGTVVGTCSVVVDDCTNDPDTDCVTATVSYAYREHPIVPTIPGMHLLMPPTLRYDAVAQVG